jgi:CRP/FNR family transcriptional regulator, cyclic AMP receptor protein
MHTEDLSEILHKQPFVNDLEDKHLHTLVGCAANLYFPDGTYLFHEGEAAEMFYLIRSGRIALEMHGGKKGIMRILTMGPGESGGWSWLLSPYRWHFDACVVDNARVLALDGKCLRKKCETDHDFGYEMLKRLTQVLQRRVEATRLQLLDVYGGG